LSATNRAARQRNVFRACCTLGASITHICKKNGHDAELPKQSGHIRSVQRISRGIFRAIRVTKKSVTISCYDFLAFFFLDFFAAFAGVAAAGAAMGLMFFTFHS
jgi:hypothetical protein